MLTDKQLFQFAAALAEYHATRQTILDAEASDGQPRPQLLAGAWRDYQASLTKLRIVPTFSGLRAA